MAQKKVVTIGGGTGSFTLLSGLKNYPYDISAIVTMADDGGSTGVLRDELGVLPPGDIRQCLVALSDSGDDMRALMNYRFEEGSLEGHSFGNLLLSALEKITGSFSAGVTQAQKVLNVRGRVIPVSESDMRLTITLEDGSTLKGEKELDDNAKIRRVGIADIALDGRVHAHKDAVAAIAAADYVIIGPGDHFGSIMPNLLVAGIARALKNTTAQIIFVAPLTNKKGHTGNFSVDAYVRAVEKALGTGCIDFVLYNTKEPHADILAQYEKKEGKNSLVVLERDARDDNDDNVKHERTYKIVHGKLLRSEKPSTSTSDKLAHTRAFIRHDSDKLAQAIAFVIEYDGTDPFDIT